MSGKTFRKNNKLDTEMAKTFFKYNKESSLDFSAVSPENNFANLKDNYYNYNF